MCSGIRRLLGTDVINETVWYWGSGGFEHGAGHLALSKGFALGWREQGNDQKLRLLMHLLEIAYYCSDYLQ